MLLRALAVEEVTREDAGGTAAAQVVAVADTWETIRARASIRVDEALVALRARSGTFLDPVLVELLGAIVRPPPAAPHHSG